MNQHTRLARHFASLQALGFVAVLAACGGGGGVSVPDGVVVNPGPAPAPAPGTPPPPPPPAPNPSASTCVDPVPAVTQTAGFSATDVAANSGTAVSTNGGTVCFSAAVTGAVRSTTAITQGANSFYYFEATRTGSVAVGVGTATAPFTANNTAGTDIVATNQALLVRDSVAESNGTTAQNIVFKTGTVGAPLAFAIDYRGPRPVVYTFVSTAVATGAGSNVDADDRTRYCGGTNDTATPCVVGRYVLGAVTTPLYIYAVGSNQAGGATGKVSINTGGNPTSKPLTFAPLKVRQAVRTRFFKGEGGVNAQWPADATSTPVSALPAVSVAPASKTRAVVQVGDTTPYTSSFTVTAPSGTIQWYSDGVALTGSTSASLSLTNATVQGQVGTGAHRIEAVVTDATTGKVNAVEFALTYITSNTDDNDGDGLSYLAEKNAGTDPANPDTDGDGIADDVELAQSTDPLTGTAATKVVLTEEAGVTSRGILASDDGLQAYMTSQLNPDCVFGLGAFANGNYLGQPYSVTSCVKRAIRTNVPIALGEFRYFETRRLIDNITSGGSAFGPSLGHGLIDATAAIDPYCCLANNSTPLTPDTRTPMSMSLNSAASVYKRLANIGNFSTLTTYYIGFAVDYRTAPAKVYYVTTSATANQPPVVAGPVNLESLSGNVVYPMVYGDPMSDISPAMEINAGLKPFNYDMTSVRAQLDSLGGTGTGAAMTLGVGAHRRP